MSPSTICPTITDDVRPIYLNDTGELWCVVLIMDYDWAQQWKWKPVWSRGRSDKCYARRSTWFNGRRVDLWLHKEICLRHRGLPPTYEHTIGDHEDGDSLNDRRGNLDWATKSMNRNNRHGVFAQQTRLALLTGDNSRILTGDKSLQSIALVA